MKFLTSLLTIVAACSTFAARSSAITVFIDTGAALNASGTHPGNLTLDFTLLNPQNFAVKIDTIQDPPDLTFQLGDRNDMVRNPNEGGSCAVGTVLQSAGSKDQAGNPTNICTVEITVNLFDPQDTRDFDHDYGQWLLQSLVTAHKDADPTVKGSGTFTGVIYVLDQGVSTPVPEPASMLLIGGGFLGLGLLRRRGNGMGRSGVTKTRRRNWRDKLHDTLAWWLLRRRPNHLNW